MNFLVLKIFASIETYKTLRTSTQIHKNIFLCTFIMMLKHFDSLLLYTLSVTKILSVI